MPIREAKPWHVYRYQNSSGEHNGKYVLALLTDAGKICAVFINSEKAKSEQLRQIEVLTRLDFLPRPSASLRFDTLICGGFEQFTVSDQERKWVVTGRTRYQVLNKALSAESRLPGKMKRRLQQENLAFLNHWARRARN